MNAAGKVSGPFSFGDTAFTTSGRLSFGGGEKLAVHKATKDFGSWLTSSFSGVVMPHGTQPTDKEEEEEEEVVYSDDESDDENDEDEEVRADTTLLASMGGFELLSSIVTTTVERWLFRGVHGVAGAAVFARRWALRSRIRRRERAGAAAAQAAMQATSSTMAMV